MLADERCKQGERELRVLEKRYMDLNLGETDKKLIDDYTARIIRGSWVKTV